MTETWAMKVENLYRLERAENMMGRWICGVFLKDRRNTVDLNSLQGLHSFADVMWCGRLRWFGQLEHKGVGM